MASFPRINSDLTSPYPLVPYNSSSTVPLQPKNPAVSDKHLPKDLPTPTPHKKERQYTALSSQIASANDKDSTSSASKKPDNDWIDFYLHNEKPTYQQTKKAESEEPRTQDQFLSLVEETRKWTKTPTDQRDIEDGEALLLELAELPIETKKTPNADQRNLLLTLLVQEARKWTQNTNEQRSTNPAFLLNKLAAFPIETKHISDTNKRNLSFISLIQETRTWGKTPAKQGYIRKGYDLIKKLSELLKKLKTEETLKVEENAILLAQQEGTTYRTEEFQKKIDEHNKTSDPALKQILLTPLKAEGKELEAKIHSYERSKPNVFPSDPKMIIPVRELLEKESKILKEKLAENKKQQNEILNENRDALLARINKPLIEKKESLGKLHQMISTMVNDGQNELEQLATDVEYLNFLIQNSQNSLDQRIAQVENPKVDENNETQKTAFSKIFNDEDQQSLDRALFFTNHSERVDIAWGEALNLLNELLIIERKKTLLFEKSKKRAEIDELNKSHKIIEDYRKLLEIKSEGLKQPLLICEQLLDKNISFAESDDPSPSEEQLLESIMENFELLENDYPRNYEEYKKLVESIKNNTDIGGAKKNLISNFDLTNSKHREIRAKNLNRLTPPTGSPSDYADLFNQTVKFYRQLKKDGFNDENKEIEKKLEGFQEQILFRAVKESKDKALSIKILSFQSDEELLESPTTLPIHLRSPSISSHLLTFYKGGKYGAEDFVTGTKNVGSNLVSLAQKTTSHVIRTALPFALGIGVKRGINYVLPETEELVSTGLGIGATFLTTSLFISGKPVPENQAKKEGKIELLVASVVIPMIAAVHYNYINPITAISTVSSHLNTFGGLVVQHSYIAAIGTVTALSSAKTAHALMNRSQKPVELPKDKGEVQGTEVERENRSLDVSTTHEPPNSHQGTEESQQEIGGVETTGPSSTVQPTVEEETPPTTNQGWWFPSPFFYRTVEPRRGVEEEKEVSSPTISSTNNDGGSNTDTTPVNTGEAAPSNTSGSSSENKEEGTN